MLRSSRLSRRVFLLVATLVTTCGALVHLPSLVAFRTDYLEHRLIDAYMATRALRAGGILTIAQKATLLEQAHLIGIEVQSDGAELRLVTADVPPDATVSGDPERLARLLDNLLTNSREAGAHQASLMAHSAAAGWIIDVCDDGPGLPEVACTRLFKPFVGSTKASGHSLGLATSRDIARAHGGELELIESGSHGVCFRLTLPKVVIKAVAVYCLSG